MEYCCYYPNETMRESLRGSLPTTQKELYDSFLPKIVDPDSFEIVAGQGNIPLTNAVGKLLGKTPDQPCSNFGDGEIDVRIKPNLRGREIFIIQSLTPLPNDRLEEVELIADAARRADAQKITAILPYFAYARQDRKSKSRTPISASRTAKRLVAAGINRIFTIDLHAEQTMGSIDEPWDNVYSSKLIAELIKKYDLKNVVVVAADTGSAKRSEKFADRLGNETDVAVVYKKRYTDQHDNSKSLALAGEVSNRPVIVYDDLTSTGNTLIDDAILVKQKGATRVIAATPHAIFAAGKDGKTLSEKLKDSNCPIDELIISDTILQGKEVIENKKIKIISVAPMLAVAILCYLTHDSIGKRLIE